MPSRRGDNQRDLEETMKALFLLIVYSVIGAWVISAIFVVR